MHTDNPSSTLQYTYVMCVLSKLLCKLQKYVFHHYKVWVRKRIEKDDFKLPRKRKISDHFEEEEAPVKFVSKVEEDHCQLFFIKQLIWLSTVFVTNFSRMTSLKRFRQLKFAFKSVAWRRIWSWTSANFFVF